MVFLKMHTLSCFISQITCKVGITSHCLWPQFRDQMESFLEEAFFVSKGLASAPLLKGVSYASESCSFQCCTSTYFLISLLPKIAPRLCLCWMEKAPNGNTCKLAQKKPQILTGLYVPENICSYRADQLLSNSASLPPKVLLASRFRWRYEVSALSEIQLPHRSFPLALQFDLNPEARNFVTFNLS